MAEKFPQKVILSEEEIKFLMGEDVQLPKEDEPLKELETSEQIEEKQEPAEIEEEVEEEEKGDKTPNENRKEFERTVREATAHLDDPERVELVGPEEAKTPEEDAAYLANRSGEIDAEAEKKGGVIEKYFRKMGETYNKLSTREKIGAGIALGLGAGGLMTVSVPAALVFCGGIWVQRVAGAASMFMKYENATLPHDEEQKDTFWKWGAKEKAMGKAVAYTAMMTGGILLAVEGVKEGTEWLGHHWPNHPEINTKAPIVSEQPAAAAAAGESATTTPAPEMPAVSVNASAGHGYEYMLKQLSEQLQDKNLDPSKFDADSDVHKLLTADSGSIDKVVHQIASDPQHGFFNADGTSVQINPDDHIFIAADGQVHVSHDFYNSGSVQAPEGAPVTPAYSPEVAAAPVAPEAIAPSPEVAPPAETDHLSNKYFLNGPRSILNSSDYPLGSHAPSTEVPSAIETAPPVEPTPPQVTHSNDVMNTRVFTDGTTHKVLESTRAYSDGYTEVTVSENGNTIERVMTGPDGHIDRFGADGELVQIPDGQIYMGAHGGAHSGPLNLHELPITNHFGLTIPTDEAHIYSDGGHVYAYGGSLTEEKIAVTEYLSAHPNQTVYGADNDNHRILWRLTPDGKNIISSPVKTNGFFGLFKSFMGPPDPESLKVFIK